MVCAASGMEVLNFFRSGVHVDLMLLDIRMPGMSGLDALRAAEVRPSYPVFAMTGHVDVEAQDEFKCVPSPIVPWLSWLLYAPVA